MVTGHKLSAWREGGSKEWTVRGPRVGYVKLGEERRTGLLASKRLASVEG